MADETRLPRYLDALNPEQRAAVVHENSPLLILAGAGSGKTRVITTKIAYLIGEKKFPPQSILAVTFTKKAANEMRERAVALEPRAQWAQIRTFHSFGAWFLRKYHERAGLAPSFTVYDDDDMATLVSKAVPSLAKVKAARVARKISLAKDYCLDADDDLTRVDSTQEFARMYRAYQERLGETGNADFGDLIMKSARILESDMRAAGDMRARFRVIMVDEYQDSNIAQFRLLQLLAGVDEGSGTYVCVVGDDDQSIYKFRGAEVQNILAFREKFPGAQIIKLTRNYRSTAKILEAAGNVVSHNEGRIGKTLSAERGEGKRPVLVYLPNQDEETKFCADMILRSRCDEKNPAKFSDWAILYRTNAQSLGFETEFLRRKIPYVVVGSLKFYEREEIKDTLAFLSLVANPRDEVAFRRVINKPARGIGDKTQDAIVDEARKSQSRNLLDAAKNCEGRLSKKAKEGARAFRAIFDEAERCMGNGQNLSVLVQTIVEKSGLLELYKDDEIAGAQRAANMQELSNSAVPYECDMEGLLLFLDSINLDRSLDAAQDAQNESDAVTLITLHNTKGLEFPRVVITGLEAGIFPRADKIGADLEEERRLFYVGITRARNELYVTSCAMRRTFGRTDFMQPSVFINEAGDVFKVIGQKNPPRQTDGGRFCEGLLHSEKARELSRKWRRGERVYHDDFGYGRIIRQEISDEGEFVITVVFESSARKKFMPEYQTHSLMLSRD